MQLTLRETDARLLLQACRALLHECETFGSGAAEFTDLAALRTLTARLSERVPEPSDLTRMVTHGQ